MLDLLLKKRVERVGDILLCLFKVSKLSKTL
jgi:hypothetical protein